MRARRHPRVGIIAALLLAPALGGCGGAASAPSGSATGAPCRAGCPYRSVALVGQRGEGVLRKPEAVALSPTGEVYVGDQFSSVVQRFSATGRYLGEFGSYGSGDGQFGSVDGLAVDRAGAVYLIDSPHNRVQKFSAQGRFLTAWGHPGRAPGNFHFGAGAGPGSPPGGAIAVDDSHVYVADTGNQRIQRFNLDGGQATVWDGASSGTGPGFSPRGVTAAPRGIYVADEGNRRVELLDRSGHLLARAGRFGTALGQFSDPFGVAVDAGGDVFVADNNNNRVVRLTSDLRFVTQWRGAGRGQLSFTRALTADAAGHVYVTDTGNDRIVVFSRAGELLRTFGRPVSSDGQLATPLGVAADRRGGLLVVETFGSRGPIYRFGPTLAFEAAWTRGGGAVLGRHFFSPSSVAVAPDGSVWVNDRQNGLIRHLSADGVFLGAVGAPGPAAAGGLLDPSGVAVDLRGNLYVADTGHDRVRKYSAGGRPLRTWGPDGPTPVRLTAPLALAVDARGRVYVADSGANRVVVLDPRAGQLRTWGGRGSAPGRFLGPAGIAVDPQGRVFVVDAGNARIEKFDGAGHLLGTWGRTGTAPGEFSGPGGVAVSCRGELFVADTHNNRVQVFRGAARPSVCATSG